MTFQLEWKPWVARGQAVKSVLRPYVPRRAGVTMGCVVALGVIAALWLAMWLQLQSPFWAGSTVVITYQATRGQSLLKGVNRLIGTAVGTAAGVALVALFPQQWVPYLLVHTLWLVLCTAVACWLTPTRAYAAALSGYTALIVAFDAFGAPQHAFETAVSRGSAILVGVLVFTLIARVSEPSHDAAALRHTLEKWEGDGLKLLDEVLRGDLEPYGLSEFIGRVADLDELLEEGATQARWVRRAKPVLRSGVLALCDALMLAAAHRRLTDRHAASPGGLDGYGERKASVSRPAVPAGSSDRSVELSGLPALVAEEVRMARLDFAVLRPPHALVTGRKVGRRVDHDRRVVVRGVVRSIACFGLACAAWVATRWPSGATFATIAGILCGLFSFRPAAAAATQKFVVGTLLAAAAATWIGLFVLPDVESFEALALVLFPFVLAGAVGVRTTALSGYAAPFNLLFLSMVGVRNIMDYDALDFFNSVGATVAGALLAALWYRICPPLSTWERADGLRRRIQRSQTIRFFALEQPAERLLYLQRLGKLARLTGPLDAQVAIDASLVLWQTAGQV